MKDWAEELDANDSITNDLLDEQLSIKEYVEDIMGIDWDDFSESNDPELMQRVMSEYNAYLSREDRDFAAAIADDLDADDFLENAPDEEISDIDETVVDDLDSDNTIESDDEIHFEENSNDVIVDDLDSDNTIMAASEVEPDRINNDIAGDSLDLDNSIEKAPMEQISISDIFNSDDIAGELIALKESGQYMNEPYATTLKEVWDLIDVEQNPVFHPEGDAFNHTMIVVRSMQQDLNGDSKQILAALAHDFGKASTTQFNEKKGIWVAYGHDKAGVELAKGFIDKIGNEVGLSEQEIVETKNYVANMVEHHMQPNQLASNDKAKDTSFNKMFDQSVNPRDLIKLAMCDALGSASKDKTLEYQTILGDKLDKYNELMQQPHVTKEMLQLMNVPENKINDMYDFAHKLHVSGLDLDKQLRQTFGQFKMELTKDMLDNATMKDLGGFYLEPAMEKSDSQYVRECLSNSAQITDSVGGPSLLDQIINQRLDGPTNAGSDFGIKDNVELTKKLYQAEWHEIKDPNVTGNKRVFEANIPGNIGVCSIVDLPKDTKFYAIDPKNTGNVMLGASNVPKTESEIAHVIVSQATVPGQKDVVVTAFPGPIVADQSISTTELKHGQMVTLEEAKAYGFDTVKFISPEMEHNLSLINQEIAAAERNRGIDQADYYQDNSEQDWDPLCDD